MSRGQRGLICAVGLACALASSHAAGQAPRQEHEVLIYIGTYTRGGSEGIYAFRFDQGTGALRPVGLAAATSNPSFLVVHPNGRWLYAVNEDESYKSEKSGAVSAFAIDRATARLTALNQQSSRGAAPCHLTIDRTGRYLLVANYSGGNVVVLPIGPDGRLGEATSVVQHTGSGADKARQEGPHAHAIVTDETNGFAIAADLGTDKLLVYRFDASRGVLTANDPPGASLPPGAGPRHVAFAPSWRRLYAINELSSTIAAFRWDASTGVLTGEQSVRTLPAGFTGASTTAEIAVHPSGRFLYGSNRGHDSIAAFRVDPASGALALVEHEPSGGRTPRNFALDREGRWLIAANQDSNSLIVFKVDQQTGALERTGGQAAVTRPVCVAFVGGR